MIILEVGIIIMLASLICGLLFGILSLVGYAAEALQAPNPDLREVIPALLGAVFFVAVLLILIGCIVIQIAN